LDSLPPVLEGLRHATGSAKAPRCNTCKEFQPRFRRKKHSLYLM
jgi:hypothetical protein